jgi:xylose isomerase
MLEHQIEHAKPVALAPQPQEPQRNVYDIDHARALRSACRGLSI